MFCGCGCPGPGGPGIGRSFVRPLTREDEVRDLREYQRDLERRAAEVADAIRRLEDPNDR
jgi:hypothetical protein